MNARLEVPRELFDPEYEFDDAELWPDVGEVLGFDAAQETMREYWETFDAYRVEMKRWSTRTRGGSSTSSAMAGG